MHLQLLFARDFSCLSLTCLFSVFCPLSTSLPYIVCPGREHRITSPSPLHHPKKQGLAAVDSTGKRGRSSKQKRRSKSADGRERRTERRRRRRGSEGGGRSGVQSPVSEPVEEEHGEKTREVKEKRRKRSKSLPKDAPLSPDDSDAEREKVKGRKRGRSRSRNRSRSRSRVRKGRSKERVRKAEGEEPEKEEEQEVAIVEERVEERVEEVEQTVVLEKEDSEEEVILPIPSTGDANERLPRPKQSREAEFDENLDMLAEYRELQQLEGEDVWQQERSWGDDEGENRELKEDQSDDDVQGGPLPSEAVTDPVSQRKPFSFLTSTLSEEQLWDDESESGGSQSDGSVSAASISGLSLAATEADRHRDVALPGPWLKPSQQRVAQVIEENRRSGKRTGQGGRRSALS